MLSEREAPLVSVVIPCYNQAQFLREAIEGVLAQTHPRVELVVVDDGSSDNTVDVVAHYPRVRCVRQENRGVAEARNAGFRATSGQYVLFIDADDRLTPKAVEAHLRCFAEHPQARFVVGDVQTIMGDESYRGSLDRPVVVSAPWHISPANMEAHQYRHLLEVDHIANTIAVMFQRSAFEAVGGFKTYFSPAEDYELLLRTARVFPSAHHRTIVAYYRRHSANTTRQGLIMLRAMRRVMRSQREFVEGDPPLEAAWRRGKIYWRDFFGRVAVKEIYAHLGRRDIWRAAQASGVLLLHVRGRLAMLPWKYRRRLLAAARQPIASLVKSHSARSSLSHVHCSSFTRAIVPVRTFWGTV
jgi:glycosyltransferase involved in cell wall biosynthesis